MLFVKIILLSHHYKISLIKWQGWQELNPRPSLLESDALPTELHPYLHLNYEFIIIFHNPKSSLFFRVWNPYFFMQSMFSASWAMFLKFKFFFMFLNIFFKRIISFFTFRTHQLNFNCF